MLSSDDYRFSWKDIGDIKSGRPNLGPYTYVSVYRLMQFTVRSVLIEKYGNENAADLLYRAGKLAGEEFCESLIDTELEFGNFIDELQKILLEFRIGILSVEKADSAKSEFTVTVSEDLDCSGLPADGDKVCNYDEGFISGILKVYTGKEFTVKETGCWSNGERICRFEIKLKK